MERLGCEMRSGLPAIAAAIIILFASCSRAPVEGRELIYVSADGSVESGGELSVVSEAPSAVRPDSASSSAASSAFSRSAVSAGDAEASVRDPAASSSGGGSRKPGSSLSSGSSRAAPDPQNSSDSRSSSNSRSSSDSQNSPGSQAQTGTALSLDEAVSEVNAAITRTFSAAGECFEFTATLQKNGASSRQWGTVSYNNNAGLPVFTRQTRFDMPDGSVGETDYTYDGRTLVCRYHTAAGDQVSAVPYDASRLPVYVMSLTPLLSAGSLSSWRVWKDADGLHLTAAPTAFASYAQVLPIAGIASSGAALTGVTICYTVGPAGTLSAAGQTFGITAGGVSQTFILDKTYR